MADIFITSHLDTTLLVRGINAASDYSEKTLPELVNTAAYIVVRDARRGMPFVTPERVDSELGTIVTPKIGKRGKALSTKQAKNRTYSSGAMVTMTDKNGKEKSVPLAVAIVAARAVPDSRYNRLTNRRYLLDRNPFRGVSRAAGAAAMRELVDRMIKSRHKSGKFLMAGWLPALATLRGFLVSRFMQGTIEAVSEPGRLGSASPARHGLEVSATIENDVGMEGVNAANFNRALLEHGYGPLQAAIDDQATKNMNYALKKMGIELEEVTAKHWH